MRVRRLIREPKTMLSDTGWRSDDMPPRHAPVFLKTVPIRAGWTWRSAKANSGAAEFVLLGQCQPQKDNWKAMLILLADDQKLGSAIARYEHHGSHPGLHGHSHCERGGVEFGPSSVDGLLRIPSTRRRASYHRRTMSWTPALFWESAKRFFRFNEPKGPFL